MLKVNHKRLKAYGDRLDDGQMQISFTFPVAASPEAREAAKRYVEALGLRDVAICAMEPMGSSFTFFVAYGKCERTIDLTRIHVPKVEVPLMNYEELTAYMSRNIAKTIVVVGACTGSDAHTVGIDAIMNMKGYAHDYGLERYPLFKAHNLRSQLTNEELIDRAVELEADALLVSQVVTQRDSHIKNLKELHELIKKDHRLKKGLITIIGGPRLDHPHALKLGFDAGFGPGTRPSHVASFIVHEYMKRHGLKEKPAERAADRKRPQRQHHQPQPRAHATARAHPHAQAHAQAQTQAQTPAHGQAAHKPAHERAAGQAPAHPHAHPPATKKKRRRGRRGGRSRRRSSKAQQQKPQTGQGE